MGERTVMQEALFYSFSLEQHVPADHLLRSIGRFIDLSGIREHLRPYYSETGRPSIDPELLMTTVARCMAEGPIGGDGFAVDASMIKRQYDQG
jgi:transposase